MGSPEAPFGEKFAARVRGSAYRCGRSPTRRERRRRSRPIRLSKIAFLANHIAISLIYPAWEGGPEEDLEAYPAAHPFRRRAGTEASAEG